MTECALPCLNGGNCVFNSSGDSVCNCTAAWNGTLCEIPLCSPECVHGNCTGNSICGGGNTCACDAGWAGADCNTPVCASTCQNGGQCIVNETQAHICNCTAQWTGPNCTICTACPAGTHCVVDFVGGPVRCECDAAFALCTCSAAGPNCTLACANGGIFNTSTFACQCPVGFFGTNCSLACSTSCASGAACNSTATNCSLSCSPGVCIGSGNASACACPIGYVANATACVRQSSSTCSLACVPGVCIGSGNASACACPVGYAANATSCVLQPICSLACSPGVCAGSGNTSACDCPSGFTANATACVRQPVCSLACAPGVCIVIGNASVCACPAGYAANATACVRQSSSTCGLLCAPGVCVGGGNASACACPAGFAANATSCVLQPVCSLACFPGVCIGSGNASACSCPCGFVANATACAPQPPCPLSCSPGVCITVGASNVCACPAGFAANATACAPIPTAPCDLDCSPGTCVGGSGGGGGGSGKAFVCECPPGFVSNGTACIAIVPCTLTCAPGVCVIVEGEERCACPPGFIDICGTCVLAPTCDVDCTPGVCVVVGNTAVCACPDGFITTPDGCAFDPFGICAGIAPCEHGGRCIEVIGGSQCACPEPWIGPICNVSRCTNGTDECPLAGDACVFCAECPVDNATLGACICTQGCLADCECTCATCNGSCADGACQCLAPWFGVNCTECGAPCGADMHCVLSPLGRDCACDAGFELCVCNATLPAPDCSNACLNGGAFNVSTHSCRCPPNFSGARCELSNSSSVCWSPPFADECMLGWQSDGILLAILSVPRSDAIDALKLAVWQAALQNGDAVAFVPNTNGGYQVNVYDFFCAESVSQQKLAVLLAGFTWRRFPLVFGGVCCLACTSAACMGNVRNATYTIDLCFDAITQQHLANLSLSLQAYLVAHGVDVPPLQALQPPYHISVLFAGDLADATATTIDVADTLAADALFNLSLANATAEARSLLVGPVVFGCSDCNSADSEFVDSSSSSSASSFASAIGGSVGGAIGVAFLATILLMPGCRRKLRPACPGFCGCINRCMCCKQCRLKKSRRIPRTPASVTMSAF